MDTGGPRPRVGVVVLNWNGWQDTVSCLESLERLRPPVEIVLVDNASTDGSREILVERFPRLPLIVAPENLGYSGGNNLGIRHWLKRGKELIALVNNDVVVDAGFLAPLTSALDTDPDLGLVAPLIMHRERPDQIQCAGLDVRILLGLNRFVGLGEIDRGQYDAVRPVDFVMGACLLVRRSVFERAGLLDETFFMYCEEIEFARRAARAGFRAAVAGRSKVRHRSRAASERVPGLVLYYGTRNNVLVRRSIAGPFERLVFSVLDLGVRLPRRLLALRGQPRLRALYLRAVRDGYAGRGGRVEL